MAKRLNLNMPDPVLQAAIGRVSIAHTQLDHILRMTVKTLCGLSLREGLLATRRQGSWELRKRIRTLAKQKIGDGEALVKLDALLAEAEDVTTKRNELIHNVLGFDEEGELMMQTDRAGLQKPPTLDELATLEVSTQTVAHKLNDARRHGWLDQALRERAGA